MDNLQKSNILKIEKDINLKEVNRSVTERYYTPRYCINVEGKQFEDQCVLFHSNNVCLVTIASQHPLIAKKKEILKIDFQASTNINRLDNRVLGKGKHGGQFLLQNSVLCTVKCIDGTSYIIHSCLKGKLVEINENLIENPNLMIERPNSEGYIAIVLPRKCDIENIKKELLNEEEYRDEVQKRTQHSNELGNIG